jgi:hypothetical protein
LRLECPCQDSRGEQRRIGRNSYKCRRLIGRLQAASTSARAASQTVMDVFRSLNVMKRIYTNTAVDRGFSPISRCFQPRISSQPFWPSGSPTGPDHRHRCPVWQYRSRDGEGLRKACCKNYLLNIRRMNGIGKFIFCNQEGYEEYLWVYLYRFFHVHFSIPY